MLVYIIYIYTTFSVGLTCINCYVNFVNNDSLVICIAMKIWLTCWLAIVLQRAQSFSDLKENCSRRVNFTHIHCHLVVVMKGLLNLVQNTYIHSLTAIKPGTSNVTSKTSHARLILMCLYNYNFGGYLAKPVSNIRQCWSSHFQHQMQLQHGKF